MKRALLTITLLACGGEQHQEVATATTATVTLPAPSATPSATATASAAPTTSADEFDGGGNMFGDSVGDTTGGLGLSGTGTGGGGKGEAIGLGNIGHGQGFGAGHGRLGGARSTRPTLRQGTTSVTGTLPPEVIQRIVRQNFGRFRLCYENGLKNDPNLAGKITTKFVIDATGAVSKSERAPGTTMSDAGVVQCVVRGFGNLSFPQPEGGAVTVVYPLVFASGDSP